MISGSLLSRVTAHNTPAAQHHTAGNIGKVNQYINKGDVARLVPAINPANGLRSISLQKRMRKTPEKKHVRRDKTVINRQGLSMNSEKIHDRE
jgi:hypothetical protein